MKLCKKFFPFHVQQNTNESNSVPNTMLNGQAKKAQKDFQEILIRLSNENFELIQVMNYWFDGEFRR